MRNIVLGLGALGAGAYTITRGGVFQGDEEENNEVITGQFPGQGAGVGGSPITSGQAPGPSVNIEAPDTQPMDLEGLDSGFSSKKEKESSDSSGSSSGSGSTFDLTKSQDEIEAQNEREKMESVKKEQARADDETQPQSIQLAPDTGGQGTISDPDYYSDQQSQTKKESTASDDDGGIIDSARDSANNFVDDTLGWGEIR